MFECDEKRALANTRARGRGGAERKTSLEYFLTIDDSRDTNAGNVAEWWRKIVASKKTMRASGERRDRTEKERRAV